MGSTITVRIPKTLANWLQERSIRTGMPQGKIIREQLERSRALDKGSKKFMRLAGSVHGKPRDLSSRKGYSKE
jgi:hypothetical protein